jgi:hypothetical protein
MTSFFSSPDQTVSIKIKADQNTVAAFMEHTAKGT